jgi:hypothetical protein
MCNTKEKLHAVTEANKMLVERIEELERVLQIVLVNTCEDETYDLCANALEINNHG